MNQFVEIRCNFKPEELEARILEYARQLAAQRIQEMQDASGTPYFGTPPAEDGDRAYLGEQDLSAGGLRYQLLGMNLKPGERSL
jgi:hypothetical protein